MDYEIPFGAFDSELMYQEIFIPEGFEATIVGNKIILEKTESEDERIRKRIYNYINVTLDDNESAEKKKWLAWLEKQVSPQMVADAYLRGCNDTEKKLLERQGASINVDSILEKVGVKPAYLDGNSWCILHGDNIQNGICGFGYTKEEALIEFLKDLLENQDEQKPTEKQK